MQHQRLLSAALALSNAAGVIAQAASSTSDPLHEFIGNAASAIGVISSADSQQTATASPSSPSSSSLSSPPAASTTPAQPAPAASSSAAAARPPHSNSRRNLIITIVCCIVGALLLIATILACVFCCLSRRRRRRNRRQALVPVQDDEKMAFQPTPPMNPGRTYSPQNPFVPVPLNQRGDVHSKNGQMGATAQGHFITPTITTTTSTKTYPETQPIHAASRSRSRSRSRSSHPTADRPSTPIGLSGIGRPYDDMHVHMLQTDEPSPELRNSLNSREPIQRYSTSPLTPSRSSHRQSGAFSTTDSTYHSYSGDGSSSSSNNVSGSGEEWRRSQAPPREQRQQRLSDTAASNGLPPPPVPWDDGYGRRHSGGRGDFAQNGNGNEGGTRWIGGERGGQERQGSRSPATTTSGTPRRLRFSGVPPDRFEDEHRYSQGVGEAL
ncbi:hypothetical protein MMC29_007611 [Sticta canariensis]|nr:hypothetical protein [Sticta canariensis]